MSTIVSTISLRKTNLDSDKISSFNSFAQMFIQHCVITCKDKKVTVNRKNSFLIEQNHFVIQEGSQYQFLQTKSATQALPLEQFTSLLKSQSGMILLGCLIVVGILSWMSGSRKKGKIATSYWGGSKERAAARKKAKKQMKKTTRNNVALYVGTPSQMRSKLNSEWHSQGLIKTSFFGQAHSLSLFNASHTLYVPDAQRGIAAIGAAGSGKTFSVIDPLIRSAFDQGFPVCLYDFKYPAQTKRAVAYAMKRGYTVRVFAPGFPESETCNPLDLIKDEEDAISAAQLAQVVSKNFNRDGNNAGGDKFFEEAGDSLVEGILLVTKAIARLTAEGFSEKQSLPCSEEVEQPSGGQLGARAHSAIATLSGDAKYCDLMTAQAILSLPSLPARLEAASKSQLKVWTTRPLSQLISVKDSEKTAASIIGTAQRMFQRFLKRDFVGAFCGQTTLPLDLDGKVLIVFGLDRNNRDIVGPLLAAILHMIVSRNVSRTKPRKDPLVVSLDELPTLYLPALVNWLNENREDGFCGILGYQNISQLEKAYGKELARAILGGTATKFVFNPQDPESAKLFSEYLGEMEVNFKSKSRSTGKGGVSTSLNEQNQKRHLFEAAEFAKLGTGRAVIINPAYTRGNEAYVPLLQPVKVPQADIDEMNWAESKWEMIRERLIAQNSGVIVTDVERSHQFSDRLALVEELFPVPTQPVQATTADLAGVF